jgi:hypothetical protein
MRLSDARVGATKIAI